PLACGWRSGVFSRLKCAICSRKCTSCSTIGPSAPIVSELRSLTAGAPVLMVDGVFATSLILPVSDMGNLLDVRKCRVLELRRCSAHKIGAMPGHLSENAAMIGISRPGYRFGRVIATGQQHILQSRSVLKRITGAG